MAYRGYTEAQNKATQKYIAGNYSQIVLRVKKADKATDGELTREAIIEAADKAGKSVNAFILDAVSEKMER